MNAYLLLTIKICMCVSKFQLCGDYSYTMYVKIYDFVKIKCFIIFLAMISRHSWQALTDLISKIY